MKIQGRLTLGIGVLFAMILLLGIQSVSYVRQLSRATGTILADNYNSLQYAGDMLRSLNDTSARIPSRGTPCARAWRSSSRTSPKSAKRSLRRPCSSMSPA